MSGLTCKRNASPAHDFDQATKSSRWFCCKCVAAQHKDLHGNCLLCKHLTCETCQVVHGLVSVNYEQSSGNPTSGTPSEQNEQPERLEQGRSKRQKLSRVKCERCRHDKKKCLPEGRLASDRCERCVEKGFPCAEGTRATRTVKLASNSPSAIANQVAVVPEPAQLEERLKQWIFLAGYCKMMNMAQNRLKLFSDDLTSLFTHPYYFLGGQAYRDFVWFVKKTLRTIFLRCTKEILAMDKSSKALPEWFLSTSPTSTLLSTDMGTTCSKCYPEGMELTAKGLGGSLDACGELLAQQHLKRDHLYCLYRKSAFEQVADCQKRERERFEKLSSEVVQQAGMMFDSFGGSETAACVRELGLYHCDIEDDDQYE